MKDKIPEYPSPGISQRKVAGNIQERSGHMAIDQQSAGNIWRV
jgi:hypothetical protein